MNIALVDLNLLVVFDAVMRERHVTRAAKRIGMTQPAVSNALSRLRHIAKDDLFIRRDVVKRSDFVLNTFLCILYKFSYQNLDYNI